MVRRPISKHSGAVPRQITADSRLSGMEEILEQRRYLDMLYFAVCGAQGSGKSALIERFLIEIRGSFVPEMAALENEVEHNSTMLDGVASALPAGRRTDEHKQGAGAEISVRTLVTRKRRFVVADTPGQEPCTRNVLAAVSAADVAVVVVDARKGLHEQSFRHALLASLTGTRHLVLAVNKMDLVAYGGEGFRQIERAFTAFTRNLKFSSVTAIPLSALRGDNILQRSPHTFWYEGPTLLGCLEAVAIASPISERLVLPVQSVDLRDPKGSRVLGTIVEGAVHIGDEVRIGASGQCALVTEIVSMDGLVDAAMANDPVNLRLGGQIDVARGDVISLQKIPLETSDQFEAVVVWMHEDSGLIGRTYDISLATQSASASITAVKYRIDVETLAHEACRQLSINDIAVCNIAVTRPLVFDACDNSQALGLFVLVDRQSSAAVATGMIRHSLRRARNVHRQALSVTRADRERLNGHPAKVIWFTGLSGSGKSTLANALEIELHARGMHTYILDGDNVRHGLNKDLGFTEADRVENIRRIAEVARLMLDAGVIVMTAFISPFRREREMAKELIGTERFLEVFVSTTLDVCEQRDVKGLYKQARAGKIPNMTGINSPYEPPENPSYVADGGVATIDAIVKELAGLVVADRAGSTADAL